MAADYAPADGFDLPVAGAGEPRIPGLAWRLSARFAEATEAGLNAGEDWSLPLGGSSTPGREVHAVANGRVAGVNDFGPPWGEVVIVEHTFYENHAKRKIRSLYSHVSEVRVSVGDEVRRRQIIANAAPERGSPEARLHCEVRLDQNLPPNYSPSHDGKDERWVKEHYAEVSTFINTNRTLFVPHREELLVLVDQSSYKMRIYKQGEAIGEYDVSLGQGKGQKRVQGDNKTPAGMYFVTDKHRGEFPGPYGRYYGGHWIKINYPNKYDAVRGIAAGVLTRAQAANIATRWENRQATLETTALGGGIGFHGWIRDWDNEGPRHLSWGCVVTHVADIKHLYDRIPTGAMVVIF